MLLILTENTTMSGGSDLPTLVRWAREAEDAGFDAVMLSEHIVMGPDAGADGIMGNPRAYAMPGNQDPYTQWPNSIVLLSAIASVTTSVRLVAAAILAPLRHPLLLAREIGTLDLVSEGRLVVQPSVSFCPSWSMVILLAKYCWKSGVAVSVFHCGYGVALSNGATVRFLPMVAIAPQPFLPCVCCATSCAAELLAGISQSPWASLARFSALS